MQPETNKTPGTKEGSVPTADHLKKGDEQFPIKQFPIKRLLVANRGEIAVRVFATARELGMVCIAVFSDPDRDSEHVRAADLAVRLPGVTSAETYLNIAAVIAAAKRTEADAIHPGYGFLAENPDFATAVQDAGLIWVGPTPESILAMALKVEAKRIAAKAGVPLVPGAEMADGLTDGQIAELAAEVGYPLMVKASAGGGGKGMRIVATPSELSDAVTSARRESQAAFGSGVLFLERYLPGARHVEVQVFSDTHDNHVHLYERECSIQRRHQKVIEEAPSPGVTEATRSQMLTAALALAAGIGYVGAGTVEFLVSGEGTEQEFYFLEMNTRLQVEHRVTELTTGFDLVSWQLQVAQGYPIEVAQGDIQVTGHAIEARLYAEDPANSFLPGAGLLQEFELDSSHADIVDSGYVAGDQVSPHYDPLLAKIVVVGADRMTAIGKMSAALDAVTVRGLQTNRDLLLNVVRSKPFALGDTTTAFLEDDPSLAEAIVLDAGQASPILAIAAAFAHWSSLTISGAVTSLSNGRDSAQDPVPSRWRNVRGTPGFVGFRGDPGSDPTWVLLERVADQEWDAAISQGPDPFGAERTSIGTMRVTLPGRGSELGPTGETLDPKRTTLLIEHEDLITRFWTEMASGDRIHVRSALDSATFVTVDLDEEDESAASSGGPVSPVPGTIVTVSVEPGQVVAVGDTLVVLEAMKMEHKITAEVEAVVGDVLVAEGQAVEAHQVLVTYAESGASE